MDRVSKAERELVRKMQRMTNLARIRAMTEDELIMWYCRGRWCRQCPYNNGSDCCLREWLRKEAYNG